MTPEIAKLEVKRARLHEYIIMKLEERDYHGVADGAMDLRELEVESKMLIKNYENNKENRARLGLDVLNEIR